MRQFVQPALVAGVLALLAGAVGPEGGLRRLVGFLDGLLVARGGSPLGHARASRAPAGDPDRPRPVCCVLDRRCALSPRPAAVRGLGPVRQGGGRNPAPAAHCCGVRACSITAARRAPPVAGSGHGPQSNHAQRRDGIDRGCRLLQPSPTASIRRR